MKEGRADQPAKEDAPSEVIDFDLYVPTVLSRLMTRLRASANRFFREDYGLTLLEWRIVSHLASEGPSSLYAIWTEGGLDKAAVTRAVRELRKRGLVRVEEAADSRRRKVAASLTEEGRTLHDSTFAKVLQRHARLLSGLTEPEIQTLLSVVAKLEAAIPTMGDQSLQPPVILRPIKPAQPR